MSRMAVWKERLGGTGFGSADQPEHRAWTDRKMAYGLKCAELKGDGLVSHTNAPAAIVADPSCTINGTQHLHETMAPNNPHPASHILRENQRSRHRSHACLAPSSAPSVAATKAATLPPQSRRRHRALVCYSGVSPLPVNQRTPYYLSCVRTSRIHLPYKSMRSRGLLRFSTIRPYVNHPCEAHCTNIPSYDSAADSSYPFARQQALANG